MDISIIIPTCNRDSCLRLALSSIQGQTFPQNRFEVIVVDNGSSDTTSEIVEEFQGRIANLRYYPEDVPGLHNARHKGMREARTELLSFIDDDVEVFPGWLEGVSESFFKYDAVMVGGKNLPRWEEDPPEWLAGFWSEGTTGAKVCAYLSLLDLGSSVKEIDPSFVWGCNFSIRKKMLSEVGGFHPDAMPHHLLKYRGDGETAVSIAIKSRGYKALYNPRASVYHWVPNERMTFDYLYKRSFAQGVSDSYALLRRNAGAVLSTKAQFFLKKMKEYLALSRKRRPGGMSDVRKTIRRGYWDGVAFHIREVRSDPRLLQWVLKTDYWENQND